MDRLAMFAMYNWASLCKKVPNVQSRCHTKRTRPSFFWYDTNFLDFFFLIFFVEIFEFKKKNFQVGVIRVTRPSFFWYDNDSGH